MKIECRRVQAASAQGLALNEQQLRHIETCPGCNAVIQELRRVDEDLATMRQKVPETLLQNTLQHLEPKAVQSGHEEPRRAPWLPVRCVDRFVAAGIATGLAVSVALFSVHVLDSPSLHSYSSRSVATVAQAPERSQVEANRGWAAPPARVGSELGRTGRIAGAYSEERDKEPGRFFNNELRTYAPLEGADDAEREEADGTVTLDRLAEDAPTGSRTISNSRFEDEAKPREWAGLEAEMLDREVASGERFDDVQQAEPLATPGASVDFRSVTGQARENQTVAAFAKSDTAGPAVKPLPTAPGKPYSEVVPVPRDPPLPSEQSLVGGSSQSRDGRPSERRRERQLLERSGELADLEGGKKSLHRDAGAETSPAIAGAYEGKGREVEAGALHGEDRIQTAGVKSEHDGVPGPRIQDVFRRFGYGVLDYHPEEWKHVTLDRPVYFENTYLGGNARLALLDHLAGTFQSAMGDVAPHRLARLPHQRFDPPPEGGMALHVDLDRATVPYGERTRVFLQVGLKGGDNPAWRRPPLSLAVLPLVSAADARERAHIAARELRDGLEVQDAFALVEPHRAIAFTSPAKADTSSEPPAQTATMEDRDVAALLQRVQEAFVAAEGHGGLRNRRLVILTDRELGERARVAVHRLTLNDVATSIVSLNESRLASHARIALAGLGNLHVARTIEEARQVARDELASFTRVVARALRLNIQPAPGVELVQVLGSRPLDRVETTRVKAAELAVDRHVEKITGIARDRGDDDPGLQTVIPYFYGGDEHVVIVELELEGPGPVAQVSLKYKDLVDMKNQTLRATGALSRQPATQTARHEQVRKNLFSFAVARVLRRLEESVRSGRIDVGRLGDLEALIAWARTSASAGGEAAAGLADDLRMLEQYTQLASKSFRTGDLASSLAYARRAKLGRSR